MLEKTFKRLIIPNVCSREKPIALALSKTKASLELASPKTATVRRYLLSVLELRGRAFAQSAEACPTCPTSEIPQIRTAIQRTLGTRDAIQSAFQPVEVSWSWLPLTPARR